MTRGLISIRFTADTDDKDLKRSPESYFPRVVCKSCVVVNRARPQFFKDAYNKPTERSISTISGPESVFQQ